MPDHPSAEEFPKRGAIIADKYRVEGVLGVGGMGVVVSAQHLLLRQTVALKFLLGAVDESDARRFFREAHAAARIQSEHICRVMDVGILPDGGTPYIVMEKLEGEDLAGVLRQYGPFAVKPATDHLLAALDALSEAHALGIVHRDLKPSNLFLARRSDGSTILKVLDFGISKLDMDDAPRRSARGEALARAQRSAAGEGTAQPASSLTSTFDVFGTPPYMPPEQLTSAKDVDRRADIWSLGVILYELLAGMRPFNGDAAEIVAKILEGKYEPIDKVRSDVPHELARIIDRCLRRNPDERFSDAGALAAALAPFASSQSNRNVERAVRLARSDEHVALPATKPRMPAPAVSPREVAAPLALAAPDTLRAMAAWVRRAPGSFAIFVIGAMLAGGVTTYALKFRARRPPIVASTPAMSAPLPASSVAPSTPEPVILGVSPAPTPSEPLVTAASASASSAAATRAPSGRTPAKKPRAPGAATTSTVPATDGVDLGRL